MTRRNVLSSKRRMLKMAMTLIFSKTIVLKMWFSPQVNECNRNIFSSIMLMNQIPVV
jgi:hypothetical protein